VNIEKEGGDIVTSTFRSNFVSQPASTDDIWPHQADDDVLKETYQSGEN
jgi:hypothetical protein